MQFSAESRNGVIDSSHSRAARKGSVDSGKLAYRVFETAPFGIKARGAYGAVSSHERSKQLFQAEIGKGNKEVVRSQSASPTFSDKMSLLPFILRDFWEDPWSGVTRPSRLFDQGFGNVLTDEDLAYSLMNRFGPQQRRSPPQSSGMSEVVNNESEFRIGLDVRHFKPEELKVTTKNNRVIINAKHEDRPDEHGYVMREFTRQYVLPKDVDPNTVTSGLSRDGVLTIKAPKKALEAPRERAIPITHEPSGDQAAAKED